MLIEGFTLAVPSGDLNNLMQWDSGEQEEEAHRVEAELQDEAYIFLAYEFLDEDRK
jgi:hypothetical protein